MTSICRIFYRGYYTLFRSPAHKGFCKKHFATTSDLATNHASLEIDNKIGIITLKSPGKVNVLNLDVAREIEELFAKLQQDSNIIGGVLISNKTDCFIAGADINMFSTQDTMQRGRELSEYTQALLDLVETTKKPVVAAIMGSCLGGGLEVALACHYRLAVDGKATFGLPEVLLGLLPGAGGTQRLPRLIGLPDALDIILSGKTIRTNQAINLGLVDQTVKPLGPGLQNEDQMTLENLQKVSVETARKLAVGDMKIKRGPKGLIKKSTKLIMETKLIKNYIFKQARKKVLQQTKGLYPSPLKILEVVKEGQYKGEKAGFKAEAKAFGDLLTSNESKSLVSLFHGQTECKKNKFGTSSVNLNTIAIVGAGQMGTGIASISISNGFETLLKDTNSNALQQAESHIQNSIKTSVKKNKISSSDGDKRLSRFWVSRDTQNFSKANVVIEAVDENIEHKQNILGEIEKLIPEKCIYATTTSSLLISDISKFSKIPEKIVGLHYSSPVDKMQLVEVVRTKNTSTEALQTAVELVLKQKKVPITVKDGPGFYTFRVFTSMSIEAFKLVLEGINPEQIDKVALKLGFPKGPIASIDEVGIDIVCRAYNRFVASLGNRFETIPSHICDQIIATGNLGKKSEKGFYLYQKKSRKEVNQEFLKLISKYNVQPKIHVSDENIKLRLLLRFVNESLICLEEDIISNPLEGDVGAVFGLGFPPFTGGPFHYVDSLGASNILSDMRKLEEAYGPTFTPCQLLLSHANDSNKKFFK